MEKLNLVVAIIYTVVYALLFLSGLYDNDGELIVGTVILATPVVVNWMSWKKFKILRKDKDNEDQDTVS